MYQWQQAAAAAKGAVRRHQRRRNGVAWHHGSWRNEGDINAADWRAATPRV